MTGGPAEICSEEPRSDNPCKVRDLGFPPSELTRFAEHGVRNSALQWVKKGSKCMEEVNLMHRCLHELKLLSSSCQNW